MSPRLWNRRLYGVPSLWGCHRHEITYGTQLITVIVTGATQALWQAL